MSGTEENNSAGATAAEEEATPSTSTSTRPDRNNELQTIVPVAATSDIMEIIQQRPGYSVNVNLNIANAEIRGQNIQVGDQCTMPLPGTTGSDSSEKLKKLLGESKKTRNCEADLQLQAYRKHEGAVFIEPPAFKACQKKLEKGGVTIVGDSGDGKTTIAKELLLRQTKRRAVIIADKDDWKEVDLAQDENIIILFDDMLGKFVSDSKKYWKTKLDKIFDAVRNDKIEVVITCRETVLSRCREELEHFELFKPENRVHLSGPNSTCNLDTDTKRKMIHKHINSMSNISICDKLDDENLSGDERKICSKSLEQIALKNCPSFPQCCKTFVSMPACFTEGDTFFDNPTECLIKEIDRMRTNDDNTDQFNYCTLVCVLFYGKLTVDTVEKQSETIKVIANSCRINASRATLHSEIGLAASRLSTSYLIDTCDSGHTFQHNSLLQAIFSSFFKSQPKLLIEHCEFNLIQSLVTTEQATEKSYLFCKIQGGTQTDSLCSRLATEIMASNVIEAVGHRALTDPVFVSKFFSYIKTSSIKKTVLKSTQYNESILYWAAGLSDKCFMEPLLTEMKSVMFLNTKARMGKKMSTALCGACRYGNYGMFTLLISRPGVKVTDICLRVAAIGGHDRIVTDLLSVRKWSIHVVTEALYTACSKGRYDMYRSLITHDITSIDYQCLCKAAQGGHDRVVTDLLSVKMWSTHGVTQALYKACSRGRYDVYRSLITYDVTAIDDTCLRCAAIGGDDHIVTDLLSVKMWSTHGVTQALYKACSRGRYDVYRSLITYDATAIDDTCLRCAAIGGDDHIVTDLLSVKMWSTHDVTQALYTACIYGRHDVFRSLITYDVTAIDNQCLWMAASDGDDRIVTDLLSVKKWSTHDVTQALYCACSKGRYDVYRSLITHDVTAIDDRCLRKAASDGDGRIVTDLLSVKMWSTHDVTQALYEACSEGRYDMYRSLITYDVTAIDDECLWWAAYRGNTKIKDDLLSKGYKLLF